MNPRERIGQLKNERVALKARGEYRAAIPLQLEILELLAASNTPPDNVAAEQNQAAILHVHAQLYSSAERHARQALALAAGNSVKDHLARGAYNYVLAQALAAQYRFDEAVPYGEEAIREYACWHHPPDEFLKNVIAQVDAMRNRTWSPPAD